MNLRPILRKNAVTLGMLLVTFVFYGYLLVTTHQPKTEHQRKETIDHQRMTQHEMQLRETRFRERMLAHPFFYALFSLAFLGTLLLGIVLNVYFFILKRKRRPLIEGGLSPPDAKWGLSDVFQVFVLLFFLETCFVFIEINLFFILEFDRKKMDLFMVMNSLIRDLLVAGFVVYLIKRRYLLPMSSIGLTTKHFFKNVKRGLVGYVSVVPPLALLLTLILLATQIVSYEPPPQPVVEMYFSQAQNRYLIMLTLFVAVLGPILEEMFFRGFFYRAFRAHFGIRTAMVITSFLFAAMHLSLVAFFPIFFLGLFLNYLAERTGSLVPSMTAHMTHNLIMVGFTLFFKNYSG
jgi:uncharacterized protein